MRWILWFFPRGYSCLWVGIGGNEDCQNQATHALMIDDEVQPIERACPLHATVNHAKLIMEEMGMK